MIDRELLYRQRRQMMQAARELQGDYKTDPAWIVRIDCDQQNGLSKDSAADDLQSRSAPSQRLVKKMGMSSNIQIAQIGQAVLNVIQR